MKDGEPGPPILQAEYVNFTPVRGRGVIKIEFEIPHEAGYRALQVLGFPNSPGRNALWVGIVPLEKALAVADDIPTEAKTKQTAAMRAALLCRTATFWEYLIDRHMAAEDLDEEGAAERLRELCEVGSRADLDTNRRSRAIFEKIESEYSSWLMNL